MVLQSEDFDFQPFFSSLLLQKFLTIDDQRISERWKGYVTVLNFIGVQCCQSVGFIQRACQGEIADLCGEIDIVT